jgi:hypothetical protein
MTEQINENSEEHKSILRRKQEKVKSVEINFMFDQPVLLMFNRGFSAVLDLIE